jgi:hypothetical protein
LKATLARVQAERDDALRKTGILEERVDKLMASTSWKVTSPLRAISRKLRNR